jgi:hypothetical protein
VEVAALRKDREFGAGNALRHLHRQRIRDGVVLVAGQDQRRTGNRGQRRPRIRPAHHGGLLAHEGVSADIVAHIVHQLAQARILAPRRMHEARKQFVEDGAIFAGLRAGDLAAAADGGLRRIGARLGIDQRQFCNPIRRLPHDLERDVAAHRMPRQRETRRRLGQDPPRDRAHAVVANVVGHRHGPESPHGGDDRCEYPGR